MVSADQAAPVIAEVLQAWSLALQCGNLEALPWLLAALLAWHEAGGRFAEGVELVERALEALDERVPAEAAVLAQVLTALATLRYRLADYDAALDTARRAQRLAEDGGQKRVARRAANVAGLVCWMQHRLDEAHAIFRSCLDDARAHEDRLGQAVMASNLALIDNARGQWASAEAHWRDVLELDRRLARWEAASSVHNNLGNLCRHLGRFDEAELHARESLRLSREHGLEGARPFAVIGLALLQLSRGQPEGAQAWLDLLDGCDPAAVEGPVRSAALLVRARIAIDHGARDAALREVAAAVANCQRCDDAPNLLEALATYGRWLARFDAVPAALALWRGLALRPILHAALRDELQSLLASQGDAAGDRAEAPLDVALAAERVLMLAARASG